MCASVAHHKLIEAFIDALMSERGLSRATALAYTTDLNDAEAFMQKKFKIHLAAATPDHIQQYVRSLHHRQLSSRSVARYRTSVRQFFQYLLSEKIRSDQPALDWPSPKQPRHTPATLTEAETNQLLDFLTQPPLDFARTQMLMMLEILYGCGLRVSELIHLHVGDVDLDSGWVRVLGKGNKERRVPLTTSALELWPQYQSLRQEFLTQPSPTLFPVTRSGRVMTRQWFAKRLKQLALNAGLTSNVHPHILRHAFATHLLARGADLKSLQQLLGHASINSTAIYTHVVDQQLHQTLTEHHPLALNKQKKH